VILLFLLCISLFFAIVLAFVGDWKYAPEINILGSGATFVADISNQCEFNPIASHLVISAQVIERN